MGCVHRGVSDPSEIKALASLMFSGMDLDGGGFVSEQDMVKFFADFNYYGIKLVGALLFDISFFDRAVSDTVEYHALAREIEKRCRSSAPDLTSSATLVHSFFSRIEEGSDQIAAGTFVSWAAESPELLVSLGCISSASSFTWIVPEPAASLEDEADTAVRTVMSLFAQLHNLAEQVDQEVLHTVFASSQIDID